MAFTLLHTSTVATTSASGTLTVTFTSSTAGNLLTAMVAVSSSTVPAAPTGWALRNSQASGTDISVAIYDFIGNPGGLTSAAFTVAADSAGVVQEWTPPAGTVLADQTGTNSGTTVASPETVTTSGNLAQNNELAVAVYGLEKSNSKITVSAGSTFTQAGNWGNGVKQNGHATFDYLADTGASSAGATLSDSPTTSSSGTADFAEAIATYQVSSTANISSSDAGTGTDAGESITASLSSSDAGTGTDAGESITANQAVSDSDAASGTDGGEAERVASPWGQPVQQSRTWQARWRPGRRLVVPKWQPAAYLDSDTGHGADAGESISATLSSSDTGHGADAGELITATLSSSDTGHGADAGESISASLSASDAGTGTTAGESITATLSSSDTGHGTDGGESYTVLIADSDTGHGADAGESISASLSASDAASGADGSSITASLSASDAGTGTDAGESITASLSASDTGHGSDAGESLAVTLASSDTGRGTDAGESITASLSASDTGTGADAGESLAVTLAASDAVTGTDAGELLDRHDFSLGATLVSAAWLTRWGRQRFPKPTAGVIWPVAGGAVNITDADAALGEDAEIDNPFPVQQDVSGAGADGGELVTATLKSAAFTSDTSQATDAGELLTGTWVILDADACRGTDAGFLSSAQFSGTDSVTGFDRESARFGPDASPSDSDTATGADQEIIDVYAYQPLFRWDGGSFRTVAPVPRFPVPLAAPAPPPRRLEASAVLEEALRVTMEIAADD